MNHQWRVCFRWEGPRRVSSANLCCGALADTYIIMAVVPTMAMGKFQGQGISLTPPVVMEDSEVGPPTGALARRQRAEDILAEFFAAGGWKVGRAPTDGAGAPGPDLVVQSDEVSYAVEVKAAAEGRSDRLIPLWAQAYLQAARAAGAQHVPLAVVAAPHIAARAAAQVLNFAAEYAPDAAVGVMDFAGLRLFRGPHLEGLDAGAPDAEATSASKPPSQRGEPTDVFSDLNQWMLKVLLAPEVPEALLTAPRGRYSTASQLARAADVSMMSASRFVQQLRQRRTLLGCPPLADGVPRRRLEGRLQSLP